MVNVVDKRMNGLVNVEVLVGGTRDIRKIDASSPLVSATELSKVGGAAGTALPRRML